MEAIITMTQQIRGFAASSRAYRKLKKEAREVDLYFKPEGNGLMLCPEDETPSEACDAQPEELDVAGVIENFQRLTTSRVDRLLHRWAGLRTFVPDRRPVIGHDPGAEGFFWLAGLGGFGVQTSPGVGKLVADAIVTGIEPDSAISVGRFVQR